MREAAEASIGEDDIPWKEEAEESAEEFAFVHVQGTLLPVEQSPAGQTETSDEFGDRETATFLLVRRLRESPLITGRIGHGDAGAIHDFDMAAAPELVREYAALHLIGGVPMDGEQRLGGKL